jgi:hypothetical protein
MNDIPLAAGLFDLNSTSEIHRNLRLRRGILRSATTPSSGEIVRRPSGFIEPCQPSKVARLPSDPLWVHEIKQDGYRLMVRRGRRSRPLLYAEISEAHCLARPALNSMLFDVPSRGAHVAVNRLL